MSLLSKRFYNKSGKIYSRDPNDVRKRKDNIEVFPPRDDVKVGKFAAQDIGAIFNAVKGADGIGGGDGFYFFDGVHMRKLGFGEGALVTCTSGAEIVPASQQRKLFGMSCLPITSATDISVGTATTKPILPDGYAGQELTIVNTSANRTVTLTDQGSMAASNLILHASTVALAPGKAIRLVFTSAVGDWTQVGPVVDA